MNPNSVVLVTGGAGFIGSHLCEALLKHRVEVYTIDNLSTGRIENLTECFSSEMFHFSQQDICDGIPFDKPFDWICHLASPASPEAYRKDPIGTIRVNTEGTRILLEYARLYNTKVLMASTSEVYGNPLVHPQPEYYWGNVNSFGERACYDEGKRCAESLCYAYQQVYGLQIQIIRIFNTYGPRMQANDGRVICNLLNQALRGEPLTIYGSGEQTRSFQFIDDLIVAIMLIMNRNKCTSPMNIGNPEEYTIRELALLLCELTRTTSQVIYHPLPKDDPERRCPDISFAKNELGWSPQISLKDGLCRILCKLCDTRVL